MAQDNGQTTFSKVTPQYWVRPHIAVTKLNDRQRDTAIVLGRFQAILNKLTPIKFQKLAEQALSLEINTKDKLQGCIDLIFKRTSRYKEQRFCIAYANLCKMLSTLKVDWEENGKMKQANFRSELLRKYQMEFERSMDMKDDNGFVEMTKAIGEAIGEDEKKKLQAKLNEYVMFARHRALGTIVFIAEMFKLGSISETVIHECIVKLLSSATDNLSLEGAALLIAVSGRHLDTPKNKQQIDGYFTRIGDIIKKDQLSYRIKFMLKDVHDLRVNAWVTRVNQEGPLAIVLGQVHADQGSERKKPADRIRKDKQPVYYRR